jgi:hypothetical protein
LYGYAGAAKLTGVKMGAGMTLKPKSLPTPIGRESGDKSPAMICSKVFDSIEVHANGNIVCWCADVNGEHVYGNAFTDRIADIWQGEAYNEMRNWMLNSKPDTWCPAINRHCSLRNVAATDELTRAPHRIRYLKLEPGTYCNLECPVCPGEVGFKQDERLRETRAQRFLPVETMIDVVDQLPDLELIEYFDYGEPFLHKDTARFLRAVRKMRPSVKIVTNTNGTVMTPSLIKAIATEGLIDRVVFSIDGATSESYKKYRIGGSFEKAYGKMKALVEQCRAAGTWRQYADYNADYNTITKGIVQITWQYIIFEWNDSDEEISLARKLAREIGVPIEWTITSGYGASKRFLPGSALEKSLIDPPESFIHLAANTDIEEKLKARGIETLYDYEPKNQPPKVAQPEAQLTKRRGPWWKWWGQKFAHPEPIG